MLLFFEGFTSFVTIFTVVPVITITVSYFTTPFSTCFPGHKSHVALICTTVTQETGLNKVLDEAFYVFLTLLPHPFSVMKIYNYNFLKMPIS